MPPADANALTDYIRAIDNPFAIELADLEEAKASGIIKVLGEETDIQYLEELKDLSINPDLIKEFGADMKIVYTPLHGTGEMLTRRALAQAGFNSVQIVESQATADPDFSTVSSPNPESQAAFALAEELGREVGADVLLATDPDADRVGVEVRQAEYTLADDSWFAVRPSGTEPKIKFYIATVGETLAKAEEKIANIEKEINDFVN